MIKECFSLLLAKCYIDLQKNCIQKQVLFISSCPITLLIFSAKRSPISTLSWRVDPPWHHVAQMTPLPLLSSSAGYSFSLDCLWQMRRGKQFQWEIAHALVENVSQNLRENLLEGWYTVQCLFKLLQFNAARNNKKLQDSPCYTMQTSSNLFCNAVARQVAEKIAPCNSALMGYITFQLILIAKASQ